MLQQKFQAVILWKRVVKEGIKIQPSSCILATIAHSTPKIPAGDSCPPQTGDKETLLLILPAKALLNTSGVVQQETRTWTRNE